MDALQKMRAASDFLLAHWPEGKEPSAWPGVKESGGRVTVVKFVGSGKAPCMLPYLPDEVGLLTELTTLELQWCKRVTALPDALGSLRSAVPRAQACNVITPASASASFTQRLEVRGGAILAAGSVSVIKIRTLSFMFSSKSSSKSNLRRVFFVVNLTLSVFSW